MEVNGGRGGGSSPSREVAKRKARAPGRQVLQKRATLIDLDGMSDAGTTTKVYLRKGKRKAKTGQVVCTGR